MEALERLQAVHAHVRLLHTHRIATALHNQRFLAHFLILLGEFGKSSAEMEGLCDVLVDAVPKMKASALFDDIAQTNTSGKSTLQYLQVPDRQPRILQSAVEDKLKVENVTPSEELSRHDLRTSEVVGEHSSPTHEQQRRASSEGGGGALVSFKSMERARSTLEDFCRSYFMFHDMDVHNPIHVFRHLPVLVFVESFIYQLDEQNEDQLCLSPTKSSHKVADGLGRDPFAGLRAILREQELLSKRIEDELTDGVEYWRLEQSLCTALSSVEEVKVEDVLQGLRLKSFDYRVLNLLLYSLRKEPVNEAHFEFLSISELLVEIADDLYDYEEDVGKNSFNVLRMFVYIFGSREAPTKLAEFIGKSEDKYQNLLKELEPSVQAKYNKRCEEAVLEGGSKSVHVLGSWSIPSLITDEEAFRKQIS